MSGILWTGKLPPLTKVMVNVNNILAWIVGNTRDITAMKKRMRLGYNAAYSDHVIQYDELGLEHYSICAEELLQGIDFIGKKVLEVGCGTGIISSLIFKQEPAKLVCGDFSEYMLDQCRAKVSTESGGVNRVNFQQFDAESLPFNNSSFDIVVSGMMLGLVPNQKKAVAEMIRVLRPGGIFALSTHSPAHYMEAINVAFRAITKRYILGYRIEFWPRKEIEIQCMLLQAGLTNIQTRELIWQEDFKTGGEAYDFFASTSASWWYSKIPSEKREEESKKARAFFEQQRIIQITSDIICAYGYKP